MTISNETADLVHPGAIAGVLRSLIVRGILAPGEHLGQTEFAKRFKISKVPVREALKQLAVEGLLQHDLNRGYFVAPLSIDEARQLYRMRRWIESELFASVRWPTSAELAAFRKGFQKVDQLNHAGDFLGWMAALEEIRRSMFELSPEKVLLREASRLWALTDRYRAILPRNSGDSAEQALVDALERRDRSALIAVYFGLRDRVETALAEALDPAGG